MLTFEKVLEIFADYLKLDQELEVCKSRYGYIRVEFSGMEGPEDFCSGEVCHTPEELRDMLINAYQDYLEYGLVAEEERDLTEQEKEEIRQKCQTMYDRCMEVET